MKSENNYSSLLNLKHLRFMTDDTGILQHARYHIPQREHGYCTDDNARALIVSVLYHELISERTPPDLLQAERANQNKTPCLGIEDSPELAPANLQLYPHIDDIDSPAGRYLSFLEHAFNRKTGRFRNFMTFDRRWVEEAGSEDSHGRALWALGMSARSVSTGLQNPAKELFWEAIHAALDFDAPRSWAFSINGLYHYLRINDHAPGGYSILETLAGRLFQTFMAHASDDWPWIDDCPTYSNAKIPQALILSGLCLQNQALIDKGLLSLKWLADIQRSEDGHFSPIGNGGWYRRNGMKARFDQQPVEAQAMLDACLSAFTATGDPFWKDYAYCCLEWFLGKNDKGMPLYDTKTGGCRDGLTPTGLNHNQGAESTLSWLIALLRILSLDAH